MAWPLLALCSGALAAPAACTWKESRPGTPAAEEPPPAQEPAPPASAAAATTTTTKAAGSELAVPPDIAGAPELRLHDFVGITPESASAVFEPVVKQIRRCKPPASGFLRLLVSGVTHPPAVEIAPASTVIDPATRDCVVKALSLVELNEALSLQGRTADAPPAVSTQVTLTWAE